MAKQLTTDQYNALKSQLDSAITSDDLLQAAAEFGMGLTQAETERARDFARSEVQAEIRRRVGSDEQADLARELRNISNAGIKLSSKFISIVIYQLAIWSVIVLFVGEVMRLAPAIATMLDTHILLAIIPTAMILIGYYATAVVGKHERKAYTDVIVTKRMKNLHDKYMNSENLSPDEERQAKQAAETVIRKASAGRGYGIVEWVTFVGLIALTAYHTFEVHHLDAAGKSIEFALLGSVGFIFLLLVVSKMLVSHIFVTSRKPIETGIQGLDEDATYEQAFGSAVYRAIVSKASKKVATDENPTHAPTMGAGHGSKVVTLDGNKQASSLGM